MSTEHKSNTATEIKDLWQTPKFLFDYYDKRFGFTCDVAASKENALCDNFISESEDSLDYDVDWGVSNWLNPPFSKIEPWIAKAVTRMIAHDDLTVMLLPADTSVKWFKLAFENCTECHFISGRLSFINAKTQKPVSGNNKGSVVFIFDPKSPVKQSVHLINRDDMKNG